ncbi:MAG: tetratricopeptide repeat protein [Pseudomonadota bacterium]
MLRKLRVGTLALILGAIVPLSSVADTSAGAYLAGRHAAVNSDYREAARYYTNALARDPKNVELLESTVLANLALGEVEKAQTLAQMLEAQKQSSQIARIVITSELAASGEFEALMARPPDTSGIGPWVDGLVKAWAQLGTGDTEGAMAAFDRLGAEAGMRGFVMYHKALAFAAIGEFAQAEAIFGDAGAGAAGQTRRGVMAHAQVLANLDRHEEALTVLRTSFGENTDPELEAMIAALEAGGDVPLSVAPNVTAGIAEVFFTFAVVLRSEDAGDYYVLLYARIARHLRPDHVDALLLTAGLLENLGQYRLAIEEYKAIPADDPAFHVAEMGRADALRRSGKSDQSVEVLEQLARTHGALAVVHSKLGDVLRSQDDYAGAIAAYDRALERTPEEADARWILFYTRGIAHERSDMDAEMERDFRAALAINPEQPQVLNYLGYSMVEQRRNLEEALDMIERAVAASPNSGYIVDSLGWVLYRLGRYDEAVGHMERAVELLPVDPVINDHLGDVYWAVGRAREAEFQWRRALSFIDEGGSDSEADPDRIRRKLNVGLDSVLEEEGAPPLVAADEI